MKKYRRKEFYAFPVDVLARIFERNGEIQGFDIMLDDALSYAIYLTYENHHHSPSKEFDAEAFAATMAVLGINSSDPEHTMRCAKKAYNQYNNAKVITSISPKLYWDIRRNAEYRGDFYMMQVVAELALKSILGAFFPKVAKGVSWDFLLSRMAGKPKKVKKVPKHVSKYATRKMRKKMIEALCRYWGFTYYAPKGTRLPWFGWGFKQKELAEFAQQKAANKRKKRGTPI